MKSVMSSWQHGGDDTHNAKFTWYSRACVSSCVFDAFKHAAEQSKNPQILEPHLRKSTFCCPIFVQVSGLCVCVLSLFKKAKSQLVKIFFHAPLGSRAMCRIASISIKCILSESWESLHSDPCWWSATEIAWGFSGRLASLSVPIHDDLSFCFAPRGSNYRWLRSAW